MNRGVVSDARSDRIPGSAIDEKFIAKRKHMAVAIESDLNVVQLIA